MYSPTRPLLVALALGAVATRLSSQPAQTHRRPPPGALRLRAAPGQSGKWPGKVKLSKRGIAAGPTALFQAAFCALGHDEELAAYYARLRAGTGPGQPRKTHKEAIVGVMRKQLRRLVAVRCSNQPVVPKPPAKTPAAA